MSTFTMVHVAISLLAIFSGFVVVLKMVAMQESSAWTALFLVSTVATSVTGFLFPFSHFTPAHGVGILSLLVLGAAIFGRYVRHLSGAWRPIYVVTSVVALYLNFFVLIVQSFQKISPLKALAPTQSEPPFVIAQITALLFFIVLGAIATRRFRPEPILL